MLELALEQKRLDRVASDLELIRNSVSGSRDLELFFATPLIDRTKKAAVIAELFADRIDDLTRRFLGLLVEKGREQLIPGITIEFAEQLDDYRGIVDAEVRVPFEIDKANKSGLQSRLEELTRKKVRVTYKQDATLIGGFLAQIRDTVYDGSVRRQLEILRNELSENSGMQN